MERNNIKIGDKFSTINALLRKLGYCNIKSNNSKIAILKEISRYIKYEKTNSINKKTHKISNEIQIVDIYNAPLDKIDDRYNIDYSKFIYYNLYKDKAGVYAIKSDDLIYIGQTNCFGKRYAQHLNNYNKLSQDTTDILNSPSGKFEILALENDLVKRLELERCYIRDFIHLQNKYKCVNKQKNNQTYKKVIKVKQCDYDRAIKMLEKSGIEVLNEQSL